jgi:uncharacterized protein (UPF0335 family)
MTDTPTPDEWRDRVTELLAEIERLQAEKDTLRMDLLDLVNCADDYGHGNEIFMTWAVRQLGGSITDAYIDAYIEWLGEGYDSEDFDDARRTFENVNTRWAKTDD